MAIASPLLALLLLLSAAPRGAGEAACQGHCDDEGLPDTLLLQTQLNLGAGAPGGPLGALASASPAEAAPAAERRGPQLAAAEPGARPAAAAEPAVPGPQAPLLMALGAEGASAHPWRNVGAGGIVGIVFVCVMAAYVALGLLYLACNRTKGLGAELATPKQREEFDPWAIMYLTILYSLWEGVCTDQYLANMPEMEVDLHTSYSLVSFSVQGIYWVRGIAGMLIGPLSDYYGRRVMLLYLFGLLPLAMAACALAPSGGWFLAARFFQGIAEGASVVAMGILRDIFPNLEERAGAQAQLYAVTMFAPMLAPPVGGALGTWLGWRSVFMLLVGGMAICLLQLYFRLPETMAAQQEGEAEGQIYWSEIWELCTSRASVSLLINMTLNMAFSLYCIGNLSLVVQQDLGLSTILTSLALALPAVLCLPGAMLADVGCQAFGVLKFFDYSNTLCLLPIAIYILNCIFSHYLWLFLPTCMVYPVVFMCMTIPAMGLYAQPLEKAAASGEAIRQILTMAVGPLVVGIPATIMTEKTNGVRAFSTTGVICIGLSMVVTWLGFLISPPQYAIDSQKEFVESVAKAVAEQEAEAASKSQGEGKPAGALLTGQ